MIKAFACSLLLSCTLLSACHNREAPPLSPGMETSQDIPAPPPIQLSARVDTSNQDVLAVVELYTRYMHSQPDSLYDNPHWNAAEKKLYRDFDFSRASLFNGLSSRQLLRAYPPFVLSVEPRADKYHIRVLYANDATEAPYAGSRVWCIHQLSAVRENGAWKLENLIRDETAHWERRKTGLIEYLFPPPFSFDQERADVAWAFCQEIIERFHPEFDQPFQFYLAEDKDAMGRLENFDYVFSGITTGKTRESSILTSKGNEHYPHEFIHMLLPANPQRGYVIEEGLATFLGTREDEKEYLRLMRQLAADFEKRESYSLENVLDNRCTWNGYPAAYPGGALVCEVVFQAKGDAGLRKLIHGSSQDYAETMALCMEIMEMTEKEVRTAIRTRLKRFE